MPRQQIIWTALPNGLRQPPSLATLKLSVFVSPRLSLDGGATMGRLDAFPDFLDWPARMQTGQIAFKVVVDGNVAAAIPARIVTSPQADSALWKALFNASSPVRSQKFQMAREPVTSYPAKDTAAGVFEGYNKIGWESPYGPASEELLKGAFPSLSAAIERQATPRAPSIASARRAMGLGQRSALDAAHREIGENLLRNDPDATFAEKLEVAVSLAGELARTAPPDEAVPIVPATADDASPFIQFAAFHERPQAPRVAASRERAATEEDIIDFHQSLSALGEFPQLLRRLGLVIDLEFPATDALRSSIGALRHLRVEVSLTPARPNESYTPVTQYLLDDRTAGNPLPFPLFAAAPRRAAQLLPSGPLQEPNFEIVGGLLNLRLPKPDAPRDQQFDIVSIDVDGAARKVINALKDINDQAARPGSPVDAPATAAAPAFRSSGLSLVRAGQAAALKADQARAAELEAAMRAGRPAELFAEDLVRGYRIDVRGAPRDAQPSDTLPWLSLHKRIASFAIKRQGLADLTINGLQDEGFVQPAFVQEPAASGAANPIYVHESFCHWQGWSLSAPPPANPMDLSTPRPPPAPITGLPSAEVDVEAAPRSLPRLRYGNSYQLRVRTVDLAGNSLSVEEANQVLGHLLTHGRPEPFIPIIPNDLPYRRHEPVPPPALVPREELTEGETLDTLVVRSNGPGTTTTGYAATVLGGGRYKGVNERHIVPPRTTQAAAETHGALDAAFGASGDPARIFNLCRCGDGTLNDAFITNLVTGVAEPLPDVTDPATGNRIPHGIRFIKIEQPTPIPGAEDGGYTVHYEKRLRLPYLPDPLARGATLFGLPGTGGKSFVLQPGPTSGGPSELKPAMPQLLPQQAVNALGDPVKIDFGRPDRWPEMVPFVLQLDGAAAGPATEPKWSEDGGGRTLTVRLAPGETKTVFLSCFPDPKDVALFGLHFVWGRIGSPEGDRTFLSLAQHGALAMLTPAHKLTLVHAVQQPVIAPNPDGTPFSLAKSSGETFVVFSGGFRIHGLSTAKLDLFASWSEPNETDAGSRQFETHVFEFPIHRDQGPPPPPGDPVPVAQYIQSTERVEILNPPAGPADTRKRLARQEFNDTKHRVVTYRLVATTRFREFFPDRIAADIRNITREKVFADQIVPSSAVPPVPEISHIVPSFGWEVNADFTRSRRIGGGLRVYLGKTWHASGAGEKLAILDDPESGLDPLHIARNQGSMPPVKPTVSAVGVPGAVVARIYPFPVHFDERTGLWYSDLTFDVAASYFPFVRLSLARYQEHSLQGMHLSGSVDAGIHQLAPDRTAEVEISDVVPGQPGKRRVSIKVTGTRPTAAQMPPAERSISYGFEVTLEQRPRVAGTDERDDHLGWAPAADQPVESIVQPAAPVLWEGALLIPQSAPAKQRIVIREYELFEKNSIPPGQGWIGQSEGAPSRRLVYADIIPVI
jgi:hypothetical protein